MITKQEHDSAVKRSVEMLEQAGIILTAKEKAAVEVADFGLGRLEDTGLQIVTYINTERVCAKELVLFPYQTCPEHVHADGADFQGKEETFRCRKGKVYLYVSGVRTENIRAKAPSTDVTVFHEIVLSEGEQYTLYPNTPHWFQAGGGGAVISEFSSRSRDECDIFTDARIKRIPETPL